MASTTGVASGNSEAAAAWDGAEGQHWAANAERYEATSLAYLQRLLDDVEVRRDTVVLDVGCGSGASTVALAERSPGGSVLGVDLSSQMLQIGRDKAAARRLRNVRFEQADAQVHPFDSEEFDLAISVFGGMFFADPVAAFANIRRALRSRGSIAFFAWRELERNEWINAIRIALAAGRHLPTPPPGAQGPFSLADRAIATERLNAAGLSSVEFASVDEPIWFGRDADHAYSFVSTLGIVRGLTADLDESARTNALAQLRRLLEQHESSEGVRLAGSAWLITAQSQ